MFVFAQEIVVQVPSDTVGRIVSVLALVVAVFAAGATYAQGRAIRKIETAQHEWEKVDRVSASIEVTSHQDTTKYVVKDQVRRDHQSWLRLRNTGRAPAHDVAWSSELPKAMLGDRASLEVLHPGEHFDVHYALSMGDAPGWLFTVGWTDDRGRHSTERRISL